MGKWITERLNEEREREKGKVGWGNGKWKYHVIHKLCFKFNTLTYNFHFYNNIRQLSKTKVQKYPYH